MGHKSLETTMRYLVPATDVRLRLEQVEIPGVASGGAEVGRQAPIGWIALRKMVNRISSLRSWGS